MFEDYLQILDWIGRQVRSGKRGSIPQDLRPILERLRVRGESWVDCVQNFGRWFRVLGICGRVFWINCSAGINAREKKESPQTRVQEVPSDRSGVRYFVIDSEERRQYEQRQREKTMRRAHEALTKVQKRVASGRLKDPAKIGAAVERALQRHYGYRYYAWELKEGVLQITEHPVRLAQEKYEGRYLLQTDQAEMTAAEAVEQYKQLTEVERGFRSLKDPLSLRPIRHRTTRRVRAHMAPRQNKLIIW